MKCPACGCENAQGTKVCQGCRLILIPENAPAIVLAPKKQKRNTRKVVIGSICSLALLFLAVVSANVFTAYSNNGSYIYAKNSILSYYLYDDDQTIVVQNGVIHPTRMNGDEDVDYVKVNMDGMRGVHKVNGTLYAIANESLFKITDDAIEYGISADGAKIWYIDDNMALYSVEIESKKVIHISDDLDSFNVCLSPDGNIVLYTACGELNACCDGIYWKLGKDMQPLCASNNGKTIYAMSTANGALYATDLKGSKREKIVAQVDQCIFNAKGTECLFSSDGKTYISINGGEKNKIYNEELILLLPDKCESYAYSRCSDYTQVKTFKNAVFMIGSGESSAEIGFLNKKYEYIRLEKNANKIILSHRGNNVFFVKSNILYCRKIQEESTNIKLGEDIKDYAVSENGKKAFIITYTNDFSQVKVKEAATPKKLAEDMVSVESFKNKAFVLSDDDTLYRMDGNKKVKIGDDVYFEYGALVNTFIFSEQDVLFVSSDGTEFSSIAVD